MPKVPGVHALHMASACLFIQAIHNGQAGADTMREAMYFRKLVQWIREEFEATPDLRLTTREAAAFLGLDLDTCERVLSQLLRVGALTRGSDGRFGAAIVALVSSSNVKPFAHINGGWQ